MAKFDPNILGELLQQSYEEAMRVLAFKQNSPEAQTNQKLQKAMRFLAQKPKNLEELTELTQATLIRTPGKEREDCKAGVAIERDILKELTAGAEVRSGLKNPVILGSSFGHMLHNCKHVKQAGVEGRGFLLASDRPFLLSECKTTEERQMIANIINTKTSLSEEEKEGLLEILCQKQSADTDVARVKLHLDIIELLTGQVPESREKSAVRKFIYRYTHYLPTEEDFAKQALKEAGLTGFKVLCTRAKSNQERATTADTLTDLANDADFKKLEKCTIVASKPHSARQFLEASKFLGEKELALHATPAPKEVDRATYFDELARFEYTALNLSKGLPAPAHSLNSASAQPASNPFQASINEAMRLFLERDYALNAASSGSVSAKISSPSNNQEVGRGSSKTASVESQSVGRFI